MDDTMIEAIKSGQWYLMAPAVVVVALRILRRPWLQNMLPMWTRWANLKMWLRQTIVFATSLGAAFVAAVLAGQGIWGAALAALPVAAAAVVGHKITKFAGHQMTDSAIAADMFYKPGITRKSLDLVLPLDHRRIDGRDDLS